jgi:hypothetical protein
MSAAQGSIGVSKNAHRREENVFLGVPTPLEAGIGDAAGTPEIPALLPPAEMIATVVLREPVGADDPEIGTGHLVTLAIDHDVLHLDRDPTYEMENSEDALVDRLGPLIHQGNGTPEQRRSSTPLSGDRFQIRPSHVTSSHCSVSHDHHVQEPQVTSAREEHLGRWTHPDAVEQLPSRQHVMAAHRQTSAVDPIGPGGCDEEWQPIWQRRQPPASQRCHRQTREGRPERKDQLPCPEPGPEVVRYISAHVRPGRHGRPTGTRPRAPSNLTYHGLSVTLLPAPRSSLGRGCGRAEYARGAGDLKGRKRGTNGRSAPEITDPFRVFPGGRTEARGERLDNLSA